MEKVLVTGATGYIGLHCIQQLLDQGYAVNGSLRSTERKDEIIEKIYSVQRPNAYLATFFRFMYENKEEQIFDSIFRKGIQHFFDLHIKCFDNYKKYPLTFVGSVAVSYTHLTLPTKA